MHPLSIKKSKLNFPLPGSHNADDAFIRERAGPSQQLLGMDAGDFTLLDSGHTLLSDIATIKSTKYRTTS